MSEKSFAVVSVVGALLFGAFFYPPGPEPKPAPIAVPRAGPAVVPTVVARAHPQSVNVSGLADSMPRIGGLRASLPREKLK